MPQIYRFLFSMERTYICIHLLLNLLPNSFRNNDYFFKNEIPSSHKVHLQIGNYYRPISVALALFRNYSIWIIYYNFYTTVPRKMVVICSNYIHSKIKSSGVKKVLVQGWSKSNVNFLQSSSPKHRKTWYLYFQASKPSLVLCPLKTPSPFKWFLRQNDSSTPMMSNAKIMTFSPLFCFNESSYTV